MNIVEMTSAGSSPLSPAMESGGFVLVFDSTIYVQLAAQFAVLFLSLAIVFVYSYFFIVRREHIHDFRGFELNGED